MKCELAKIAMMDELYDEIEQAEKIALHAHLNECKNCQQDFAALKQTSGTLQKSEDVDPRMNLVFVQEKTHLWEAIRDRLKFSPMRAGYGFAIGLASIFLLLAILNTEFSYQNGNFHAKVSVWPSTASTPVPDTDMDALVAQLRQENIQLMQSLIQQSENRQRQQLTSTLLQFSKDIETRRAQDLQMFGVGFDNMERNIYSRIQRQADSRYNNLLRVINTHQGQR